MRKSILFLGLGSLALVLFCLGHISYAGESVDIEKKIGSALESFSQLNDTDKKTILNATGIPTGGGGIQASKILAYLIFSGVGFVAFVYGKKNALGRPMVLGIILMIYPYFVANTLMIYLVGAALSAALYFWRE